MSPLVIKSLYSVALLSRWAVGIALGLMNLRYARSKIGSLPPELSRYFDTDFQEKSLQYLSSKQWMAAVRESADILLLLAMLVGGGFEALDRLSKLFSRGQYTTGVVFILLLWAVFFMADLPFRLVHTFVIEERFGFNRMTGKLWVIDLLKEAVLNLMIGIPVLYFVFWFMDAGGEYWWIKAAVFLSLVQVSLVFVYPVWIAPLFNRFTPIEEGSLKEGIRTLGEKVSCRFAGICTMDGSRRSGHGNAFFAGFGRSRRIVLFDTLREQLENEEVLAVLAHEIGHEKHHHVEKSLAVSILVVFGGFFLLSGTTDWDSLYSAFGFHGKSPQAALAIFSFGIGPILFFLSPLRSCISRRFEYEADRFAVNALGGYEVPARALAKLSEKSLSNLTPHPVYSFFNYSHPVLSERIEAMKLSAAGF